MLEIDLVQLEIARIQLENNPSKRNSVVPGESKKTDSASSQAESVVGMPSSIKRLA